MAVIVFDDGGATGLWSNTANWVGGVLPSSADQAKISADCTLDVDDVIDDLEVDAGFTLTINATFGLTGMTGGIADNTTNEIVMGAGCNLNWNTAADVYNYIKITGNGTSGSQLTIKNDAVGDHAIYLVNKNTFIKWANIEGSPYSTDIECGRFHDCEFKQRNSLAYLTSGVELIRCFISGYTGGGRWFWWEHRNHLRLENIAWGYDRAGTSYSMGNPGINNNTPMFNGLIMANGSIDQGVSSEVLVENWGYIDPSMLPGTASSLDTDQGVPGITKVYTGGATIERMTAAAKSGTYGTRVTPTSICSTQYPGVYEAYVPITSGDNLSVSIYGRRHTMTSDCAEIEIDPSGTWFTRAAAATTVMTTDDTWYEFTDSRSTASGTSQAGMCRIVLRLKEYQLSGYFDWADLVVTVT